MNIKNIIGDYNVFFTDVLTQLQIIPIDVRSMPISHLNYRVQTLKEYESLRDQLKPYCKEFIEVQFNGRVISILELKEPLILPNGYSVSVIELPAPRAAHTYPTGLEHVGFIVGETLPEFKRRYKAVLTGEKQRPYTIPAFITFDNGVTARFYERSLKEVVQLQGGQFEKV